MKKLWIKLSIFLVAVVALPMFIPGPDGRPIMSLDDWIPSDLISGAGETLGHLSGVVGSKGVLEFGESTNEDNIYTWRDEHGGIHYGDKPVEGAVVAELSSTSGASALRVLDCVDGAGIFFVAQRNCDRVRFLQFRLACCDTYAWNQRCRQKRYAGIQKITSRLVHSFWLSMECLGKINFFSL